MEKHLKGGSALGTLVRHLPDHWWVQVGALAELLTEVAVRGWVTSKGTSEKRLAFGITTRYIGNKDNPANHFVCLCGPEDPFGDALVGEERSSRGVDAVKAVVLGEKGARLRRWLERAALTLSGGAA